MRLMKIIDGFVNTVLNTGTKQYKIGDRVCFKQGVFSDKKGKTVYVVDDIQRTDYGGSWYSLRMEKNPCIVTVGAPSDCDLEHAPMIVGGKSK